MIARPGDPDVAPCSGGMEAKRPHVAGISGRCFEDCREAAVVDRRDEFGITGVAPYVLDGENAERLWELSLRLTG